MSNDDNVIHLRPDDSLNPDEFTSKDFLDQCLSDTAIEIASECMYHMVQRGLKIGDDEYTPTDLLLLSEAIKALLCRPLAREHPMYAALETMYDRGEYDNLIAICELSTEDPAS